MGRPNTMTVTTRRARLSRLRATFKALKYVLLAAVLYFFVLPLIPSFRNAVSELGQINLWLLLLGLGLELVALLFYSLLTHTALGPQANNVSIMRLFRIQLSTKSVGNIVPGGSAASSALGYRLLVLSGIPGPDAGFALATAGLGSAVVLNLILWFGLIVSIPLRGVNAVYGTAAIVGILVMGAVAALIFGLMDGQGRAERALRWIARQFRQDEDRIGEVTRHLANRLEGLARERVLLVRVIAWATANWVFDIAALWVFLRAFGGSVAIDGLVVSFGIANVLSSVPITPGGLGIVEGIYIPTLVGFGLDRSTATVGVLTYRVAQYWVPIVIGGIAYLSLRVGPFAIERRERLVPLRRVAFDPNVYRRSKMDWIEQYAPRDRTGQYPLPDFNGMGLGDDTPIRGDTRDNE
ncbi:MAG: lysylphosphatidylglycerol synthase transmembrane domain-containing protein [Ilumatobacteraceae bacterium]